MSQEQENSLKESISQQIQQQYPDEFKEQFKCSICSAKYNLHDRYPIDTCPDQHHACLGCIEKLIKDNEPCAVCKRPFERRLINKNKFIGNLLLKTATKKGLKVKIMENPEERIRKMLPEPLPNMTSNNNLLHNEQIPKGNYNPPNTNYQPSATLNQPLMYPPNTYVPPYHPSTNPNPNVNPNFQPNQPNPPYQNRFPNNNYMPNSQQYAHLNNQANTGILGNWQNKLKSKLESKFKALLFTSFVFLLIFQVFACLELTARIESGQYGYCYYDIYISPYSYYNLLGRFPTFDVNLMTKSFITRTVFCVLAMVFGLISLKMEKFRYPALIIYFLMFSLACVIHSSFLFAEAKNVSDSRYLHDSFRLFDTIRYQDYQYQLRYCLGPWEFLVSGGLPILEGILELLSCLALNVFLIISICTKPKQSNPIQ